MAMMEGNEGMQQENPGGDILASLMKQAETISQAGNALKEGGAPAEAADMIIQAGAMLAQGLQALTGPQKPEATMSSPEAAGAPSARPADLRG